MPFLSFVQGLVAARKLLERHAAVLRLLVQLPAPALAAVVALDRVGGIGGVLVKLPKIGQDERGDLPTIGTKTVELANAAGLSGIALQAGGALLVELNETISYADKVGLFLVALPKNS